MITHQSLEVYTNSSGMYVGTIEVKDKNLEFWAKLLSVPDEDPFMYDIYNIKRRKVSAIQKNMGLILNLKKFHINAGQYSGAYGDNKPGESILKVRVISKDDKKNKNEFNFTYFNKKRADKVNVLLRKYYGKLSFELNDYLYRLCGVSFDMENFDMTVI